MTEEIVASLLSGYPKIVRVPVQWGDQDAFGHVNNTVFLRWFEIGRIAYLRSVGMAHGLEGLAKGPILAALTCSFRKQVTFPDSISVGSRVTRVANTSMLMEHAVASESQGVIVADGTSTVVHFDYEAGASVRVPDDLRRSIAEFEATRTDP